MDAYPTGTLAREATAAHRGGASAPEAVTAAAAHAALVHIVDHLTEAAVRDFSDTEVMAWWDDLIDATGTAHDAAAVLDCTTTDRRYTAVMDRVRAIIDAEYARVA